MSKSAIICGVTIMPKDIVKIKFKKLEEIIMADNPHCRRSDLISHYQIDSHMTALVQGGHFVVKQCSSNVNEDHFRLSSNRYTKSANGKSMTEEAINEIAIEDHNSGDWWTINEALIAEISVENDIADSYFSSEHQLSLVLIDSVLFVNGSPITNTDSKIFEMFEKALADAAIRRALTVNFNEIGKKELNF